MMIINEQQFFRNDICLFIFMKLILILIASFITALTVSCNSTKPSADGKLRDCPEKYFEDRMPQIIDTNNPKTKVRAYFIYKGQRKELAEFDTAWVWKNCKVEKQIVY